MEIEKNNNKYDKAMKKKKMFVEATAAIPSALVVVTNDRLNSSRKMTKNWCVFFFDITVLVLKSRAKKRKSRKS